MSISKNEREADYLCSTLASHNKHIKNTGSFANHLTSIDTLLTLGNDSSGYKSICERTLQQHFDKDFIALEDLNRAVSHVLVDPAAGLFIPAAFPKYSTIVTENNLNPVAAVTLPIPDIVLVGKTPTQKQVLKVFSMAVHKPLIHQQFKHEPHAHLCASTAHALSTFMDNGSGTDAVITSRSSYEEAKEKNDLYLWKTLKANKNGVFILLLKG